MEKQDRGAHRSASRQTDRELLQQKIDGYGDMLYKLAFLQLGNYPDTEDVVQETFYQFIKTGKRFESEAHEKAWLIRVTMNGCRKVWRSAWYRHRADLPDWELPSEENMEQGAVDREQRRELVEAVMKLPHRYREVIHLFYFQEMSIKEISLATDRKEATVTSQLTRGRELLKKRLREEYRYE